MTGIVLCGGESRRFKAAGNPASGEGRINKAFLKIGGQLIIESVLTRLAEIFGTLLLVGSQDNKTWKNSEREALHRLVARLRSSGARAKKIKLIMDKRPGKKALGGIYSGLAEMDSGFGFVTACDMPFLNTGLINYLSGKSRGAEVIIPVIEERYEPLHAAYSKKCLPAIEKQLEENNLKITGFFPQVRVKEIGEKKLRRLDPELLSFFNINTRKDYLAACRTGTR